MLSAQSPSSGILQLNLKPDSNMGFKPSALSQDRFCCSLVPSARTGVIGKGGRRRTVATPGLHGWDIEGWVAQPHWCIICAVNRGILQGTEAQVTPENIQSQNLHFKAQCFLSYWETLNHIFWTKQTHPSPRQSISLRRSIRCQAAHLTQIPKPHISNRWHGFSPPLNNLHGLLPSFPFSFFFSTIFSSAYGSPGLASLCEWCQYVWAL